MQMTRSTDRPLGVSVGVLFLISSAFPVVAGLSRNTAAFPRWWGILDVVLAFVLATATIVMTTRVQRDVDSEAEAATYRIYRVLIHTVLALLVVFFLFGDRIVWINCLTGFAWRAWLLLYALPAWLTAVRR